MSFQLNIMFGGMCLLVHDEKGRELQVLMPPTGKSHAHGGVPIDPHFCRISYEPSQAQPDGTPDTKLVQVDIEGYSIDLAGLPTSADFTPAMPAEVTNLNEASSRPVDRSLFEERPGSRLLSRMAFAKGKVTWRHPGVPWHLGAGPAKPRAIAVTWSIADVSGDSLTLEMRPLNGAPERTPTTLYPKRNGQLDLYVFHAPELEIPTSLPLGFLGGPPPAPGQPADHFRAFYTLLEQPVGDPPVPTFPTDQPVPQQQEKAAGILGSLHTCVTATAEV